VAVAVLTSTDTHVTAADLAATIDWGDHTTSPGQVTTSGGGFAVSGTHTYSAPGRYQVQVSVVDEAGPPLTASTTVYMVPRPLGVYPQAQETTAGVADTNMLLAVIFDPNPGDTPAGAPNVTWGDGSSSAASVGAVGPAADVFEVRGSHTFPDQDPDEEAGTSVGFASGLVAPLLVAFRVDPPAPPVVQMDPIDTGFRVDKNSPINAIHNPAGVLTFTTTDLNKMADPKSQLARVEITNKPTLKGVFYWQVVPDGKDGGKAAIYTEDKSTVPARPVLREDPVPYVPGDNGVYLVGLQGGRCQLQFMQQVGEKLDPSKDRKLAYYEFQVVDHKFLPVKVNILSTGKGGDATTPDAAAATIQQANVYLRQVGLELAASSLAKVTDPNAREVRGKAGYFTVQTDKKFVTKVDAPDDLKSLALNYTPGLAQLTFIQSFGRGAGGRDRTQGVSELRPGNVNGDKVTVTYRLTLAEDPAQTHTMDLLPENLDPSEEGLYGVVMASGGGLVLAHEVGHMLNLAHRGIDLSGRTDGLNSDDRNLMNPGGTRLGADARAAGPQDQDLDLAQLEAMRGSKAL
jgi:hypothetical protein